MCKCCHCAWIPDASEKHRFNVWHNRWKFRIGTLNSIHWCAWIDNCASRKITPPKYKVPIMINHNTHLALPSPYIKWTGTLERPTQCSRWVDITSTARIHKATRAVWETKQARAKTQGTLRRARRLQREGSSQSTDEGHGARNVAELLCNTNGADEG